jgi:serine/threonine protein kinase
VEIIMHLHAGMQPIPGYTLTGPLGAGSFGKVWEANGPDGRPVALKFVDVRTNSSAMVASEIRVLRSLAALKHPHILPLYAVLTCERYIVLVLERADCNLDDLRWTYKQQVGRNIPPEHALDLLEQVAEALDFIADLRLPGLHNSRGLQHCDVKPTNLLLVGDDLKVADFGLCAGTGWQTHVGGWKGTLPYAPPELFRGAAARGTDQYSLAVTFCDVVMGERPFRPDAQKAGTPGVSPIDLTKLREKEFPVISRALHPYPSSRYPSCMAFIEALREATEMPRGNGVRVFPRGLHGSLRRPVETASS